jgi:tRNA pseudouridine38-40 synthase
VRWRLDISYDGSEFSGWAAQPGRRTVQGELESWLTTILRLDQPVALTCAGRTDAGVHARGQVAHLDLADELAVDGDRLVHRLSRVLPDDLVFRRMAVAPAGFDARFSAIWRRYVYRIADEASEPDPLLRHIIAPVRGTLDLDAMRTAAPSLLGLRDFAAFCRQRPGATTLRTLLELGVVRTRNAIEITVRADAFCHAMVRSLVGALVALGSGRRDLAWLKRIAAAAVRDPAVTVMPARGLTLEEVGYPPDDQLAARALQARTRRELVESGAGA